MLPPPFRVQKTQLYMAYLAFLAAARRHLWRSFSSASAAATTSNRKRHMTAMTGLKATLWPLGHPNIRLVPEIERWAAKGGKRPIRSTELQFIVRELRRCRRHSQALEVSEWMKTKGHVTFTASEHAIQIDLLGTVHGHSAAENYFNDLPEKFKTEKTYGALLNCYVKECLVDKALSQVQKMRDLGLPFQPLTYNNMMCLYTKTEQHAKVLSVLAEMKADRVAPDNFAYRICLNSYGAMSDIHGMERLLEEMECQPQIVVDWNTYTVVANSYIKAGLTEKAVSALRKAEERLGGGKDGPGYNHLISLYSLLGEKSEIWRLWELRKATCGRVVNIDYTTMLAALVKLDELERAEELVQEWESSENSVDFRVPNVLLVGYRKARMLDKAEAMLDSFLKKRKMPPPSSWGIVAVGYAEQGDMGKAHKLMEHALCSSVSVAAGGWKPNSEVVEKIFQYLRENGNVTELEAFDNLLKSAVPSGVLQRPGSEIDRALADNVEVNGVEDDEDVKSVSGSQF